MDAPALGQLLGAGKMAEVFEFGDLVAKLYRSPASKGSAFREAAALALAQSLGLPVPAVKAVQQIGDRWGVIMERAEGPVFTEADQRDPDRVTAYLAEMVKLHMRVHSHAGGRLGSMKGRLQANIRAATNLGKARQRRLLDRLATLPDGDRLCHGDFHPRNIIGPLGQELLVDWLDACCGEPAADVCRSYVLMSRHIPAFASAYVDRYCAASGESRESILRWLPFVAAARLAEDVPDEVDGLMAMVDLV
jgi:aminoglycoside phosphotransferase (APT) family kinase protein